MKKGHACNPVACASWILCKFLGALLLLMGLKMLMTYTGSVQFMMGAVGSMSLGALDPVVDVVAKVVAYTWPIASTLIGLSLLTCYKKCIAVSTYLVYLLLFILAHIWTGDMVGAVYVLVMVLYVATMKAYCGMGKMCEK